MAFFWHNPFSSERPGPGFVRYLQTRTFVASTALNAGATVAADARSNYEKIMKKLRWLSTLLVLLLFFGCGETTPFETSLVNSKGGGGWPLFNSPTMFDDSGNIGSRVALEEEVKVRVTGSPVLDTFEQSKGKPEPHKYYPVTVLSGKYAGRTGWVTALAISRDTK